MTTKERDGEEFFKSIYANRHPFWMRDLLNADRFLLRPPFRALVHRLGIARSFHPHLDYRIFNEFHPPFIGTEYNVSHILPPLPLQSVTNAPTTTPNTSNRFLRPMLG